MSKHNENLLFDIPREEKSIIKVIGVGGGGSNAVNYMFKQGIVGVDFAVCNTDNQALDMSPVPVKIQLGPDLTEGRGAGAKPEIGKEACIESISDVREFLEENTKMLFITAGMGGGTGTGAAPIIAKAAKEMDILTVGIVTKPFTFEGRKRKDQAHNGIEDLKKNVDSLIVISNDKMREIHGNLSLTDAFSQADDILTMAAKGIAEIITREGKVNVDFEDVNTVMRDSGVCIMGTAVAEGEQRAMKAIEGALASPLLEDNLIRGAQHILLNISSGTKEVTMDEIFEITEFVQEEAGFGTDLIWGHCNDESLGDKISVTLIATGFEQASNKQSEREPKQIIVPLDHKEETPIANDVFVLGTEHDSDPKIIEFDDIESTTKSLKNEPYTYDDPYVVKKEEEQKETEKRRQMEFEALRQADLKRAAEIKLDNNSSIIEFENVPAYVRRGIVLDEVDSSSSPGMSRLSINENGEPYISEENTYLHKKPD